MKTYVFQALVTRGEDGAYDVTFPSLPGCLTFGDTLAEAGEQAVDAAKTYVASLLKNGDEVPDSQFIVAADGEVPMVVAFQADSDYIVEGETVSAAEAARRLAVSPGRITHMLDAGILTGYRKGRRTYVTTDSISRRLNTEPKPGRPRKTAQV